MFKTISMLMVTLGMSSSLYSADPRVEKIYKDNKNPLWIEGGQWNECANIFIDKFKSADDDGLFANDYTSALSKVDNKVPEIDRDQAFTKIALDYISDIKGERLNPKKVSKQLYVRQVNIDEADILQTHMNKDKSCAWANNLAPNHEEYKRLKKLLSEYRALKAGGEVITMPKNTKLKLGAKSPEVAKLRQFLHARGLLADNLVKGDTFDGAVEQAVKAFQKNNHLEVDGKIGPETARVMSQSLDDKIHHIIVAMERQRWLPESLPDRYIKVNIAGYELEAYKGGKLEFTMPVITGKQYRKTPNFTAPMTEIIFNPSWHVPYNIAVKDKLPKLQNNPNAFSGKGYNFYDESGNPVSAESVNWSGLSSGNFPYRIVQSPGSANALGKIRFTIENNFSIYLHGTPDTKLFDKSKRSFSSGCIRVQDPPKLAQFVLDDSSKWDIERIREEAAGSATKRVKLKNPLEVIISYASVWHDENGNPVFSDDVYGQDALIWEALEKTRSKD